MNKNWIFDDAKYRSIGIRKSFLVCGASALLVSVVLFVVVVVAAIKKKCKIFEMDACNVVGPCRYCGFCQLAIAS